jgi:hypothetical protein
MIVQEKLIEQLEALELRHSALVTQLEAVLHLSRSTIYKRLSSASLFTAEEVRKVMQHFDLEVQVIFDLSTESSTLTTPPTAYDFINDLLDKWTAQVEFIATQDHPMVFMTTSTLPFSLAMQYVTLVKYRLFYMVKYLKDYPEMKDVSFDPSSSLFREVEVYCTRIHRVYEQLPITEIWGTTTFHAPLHQMRFLYEQEQLDSSTFEQLLDELEHLADLSEQYAKSGHKQAAINQQINKITPTYQLYLNATATVEEYTLLSWYDRQVQQLHIYHPVYGLTTNVQHKKSIENYCRVLQRTGVGISDANGTVRKSFLKKVKTAIQKQRTLLNKPIRKVSRDRSLSLGVFVA